MWLNGNQGTHSIIENSFALFGLWHHVLLDINSQLWDHHTLVVAWTLNGWNTLWKSIPTINERLLYCRNIGENVDTVHSSLNYMPSAILVYIAQTNEISFQNFILLELSQLIKALTWLCEKTNSTLSLWKSVIWV